MKARKLKKKRLYFKNLQLLNFEEKIDGLKFFEFVKPFVMNTFMLKLTQFEKTGSIGKTFISLGNLIINFYFRN